MILCYSVKNASSSRPTNIRTPWIRLNRNKTAVKMINTTTAPNAMKPTVFELSVLTATSDRIQNVKKILIVGKICVKRATLEWCFTSRDSPKTQINKGTSTGANKMLK